MSKNVAAIEGKIETEADSQGEISRLESLLARFRQVSTNYRGSRSLPTRSLPSEDGNTLSFNQ